MGVSPAGIVKLSFGGAATEKKKSKQGIDSGPLTAGVATLLRQLPTEHTDCFFAVFAKYLGILAQGGSAERLAEGTRILAFLADVIRFLGVPRESLSERLPPGLLLDMWPRS